MTSFLVPDSYHSHFHGYPSVNALLPSAPAGTFRLFRLLSLYPVTNVQLQIFPYPEASVFRNDSTEHEPRRLSSSPTLQPQNTIHNGYRGNVTSNECPPYDVISYAGSANPITETAAATGSNYGRTDLYHIQPVVVHTTFHLSPLVQTTTTVTIHITNHLLYGLLAVQEIQSPKWLFVDAICIDQLDPGDRALQVHNIDRIFRGARRVFLWLGMDIGENRPRLDSRSNQTNGSNIGTTYEQMNGVSETANTDFHPDMGMGACLDHVPALVTELDMYWKNWHLAWEHASGDKSNKHNQQQQQQRKQQRKSRKIPTLFSSELPTKPPPSGDLQNQAHVVMTAMPSNLWPALEHLRLNPWFTRLWAVQEVSLAHDPVLLYGRHSLSWSVYAKLTALCENITSGMFSDQHESKLVSQLHLVYNSRVSAIEKLRNQYLRTGTNGEVGTEGQSKSPNIDNSSQVDLLCLILSIIHESDVSLPIDRVYGILGILPAHMRDCIYTDYTPSTQNQYIIKWIEFFQVILFFTPDIAEELLSYAYLRRDVPGGQELPSWCPDISNGKEKHSLIAKSSGRSMCAGMPGGKKWSWTSSGDNDEIRTVAVVPNTPNIRLLGLQVDEILHVVDLSWIEAVLKWANVLPTGSNIDPDVARDILVSFWKCLEFMQQTGTSVAEGDAILARCLTVGGYDHDDNSSKTSSSDNDSGYGGAESNKNTNRLTSEYMAFTQYLEHHTWGPASAGALKQASEATALRFGDRFQEVARDRAFFVTRTGRSGLCSSQARQGDKVCVFMNYRVPYLLRRRDNHDIIINGVNNHDTGDGSNGTFQLIGEAYVDGIMHGEAFIDGDRDMIEEQPDKFLIS